jgi:hypothetical protein
MRQEDAWRFAEKLRTLRESELLRDVSDKVLAFVLNQSSSATFGAGDLIFEQGAAADYFFIIHTGIVEISTAAPQGKRVVAYLGPGECVGELGLLTGRPRTATASIPEQAEIIIISQKVFEELLTNHPMFLRQLCNILAHRLDRIVMREPDPPKITQLQGNLRYFDLATMFQTLMDSKRTGRMVIEGTADGERLEAELHFMGGAIVAATLGRLRGEQAVYQLFQQPPDGAFHFAGSDGDFAPVANVVGSTMSLMLEAARLQDELKEHRQRLPDVGRVFRPKAEALEWKDEPTRKLAAELWTILQKKPVTLSWMLERAPYCNGFVYQVVRELLESGQIE